MPGKVAELKLGPGSRNCQLSALFASACLSSSGVAVGFELRIKTFFLDRSSDLPYTLLEFMMNKTATY